MLSFEASIFNFGECKAVAGNLLLFFKSLCTLPSVSECISEHMANAMLWPCRMQSWS